MKIGPIFFLLFLTVISEARDEEEIKLLKEEPQRRGLTGDFVPKKLMHVETLKCLDFEGQDDNERGKLVDCDTTGTKVKVRMSPNGGGFKTLEFVGGTQAGKCLDAYAQGAYSCDSTTEQDWLKTTVGTKTFTLQEQHWFKFLDERNSLLRIKPQDLGCTCQHWKLVL